MWTAVLIGYGILVNQPGVRHPAEFRLDRLTSEAECQTFSRDLARTVQENLPGRLVVTEFRCEPMSRRR